MNLQFMLEMRKLEEDDESRFEEEYNVWLSDAPLTTDEICQLMRGVEGERKLAVGAISSPEQAPEENA